MQDVNIPEVVAELSAAFQRYERALIENDVATLTELFWQSEHTLRYGLGENLYGWEQITSFRKGRQDVRLDRTDHNTRVVTFGRDFGVANTEFIRNGRPGRQSQTWVRTDAGWRVIAAHVSWFTPA